MLAESTVTQKQAFDVVIDWARNVIKYLSSVQQKVVDPIYLFITGDGGCGKSHLAKTVFYSLAKRSRPIALEKDVNFLCKN